ncbi:CHAT domain-containing protein [Argonema antarcticum]|uniref:CHAT domain-containing protein n=1 Tax=Argonema antarcticum TaxID=2942763 RepID=UPI0020139752|nr:CHAT domain-containing protein [Argonema antarcticum]MCL1474987.1 CHAT domain-containing protein [Argonema antarcticum A004/B2]
MAIKRKAFLAFSQSIKKRLPWWLIAASCMFLCLLKSPVSAQLTHNTVPNLLKNAQELQAAGHYRSACGTLLQSLAIPSQECRTLIRDETSLQVAQSLRKLADSQLTATTLRNLGDILRIVGAVNNSEQILQQSLQMFQRLKSDTDIRSTLVSLGNTKRALGKREENYNNQSKAQTAYEAALKFYQNAVSLSAAPLTNLRAKLNQLSLLIETPLDSDIADLPQQIQSHLTELPPSKETIYARLDLARSLTCLKLQQGEQTPDYPSPIARECANSNVNKKRQQLEMLSWQYIGQLLATSIQQTKTLNDVRSQSYALGQLGELYEITQQLSSAKQLTEQALRLAQSIQAWDIAYRWQWQLGRLEIKQEKDIESAIKAYTSAFNNLQSLRKDLTALNPDLQFNFRDEVEPVYRELVDLLLKQENLTKARDVIEALQLAELNNFFREACLNSEPKQIDRIDKNAAVIYPIILKNRLEVILTLPEQPIRHHAVNISADEVNKAVEKLGKFLINPLISIEEVKNQSKQIYNWLLKPFEADLEIAKNREESQVKTLVFVLDGALRNMPMAVLYNGEKYLLERYAIALAPGLQLIDPKPLTRERINALIGGAKDAPSFQKEKFGLIDNVETELNQISKEIPSRQLAEQKFNRTNIQKQINSFDFSIVHLATHGRFSSNPDETFILAWDERIKVKDLDKLLRQKNQPQSNPIELLVLSACQTALGDKRAALGLAGVAVRAGARSTLATLWQVNDASTTELMILFYQELKKPQLTKAEALRQAQLAILKNYPDRDYQKPYYWAPFIMVGNWF